MQRYKGIPRRGWIRIEVELAAKTVAWKDRANYQRQWRDNFAGVAPDQHGLSRDGAALLHVQRNTVSSTNSQHLGQFLSKDHCLAGRTPEVVSACRRLIPEVIINP